MNRTHLVAIAVGAVLLTILWAFVVPLLLDLGDSNGQNAALGWIVLIGATIVVGWVMFRPPGAQPGDDGPPRKPRRGLRRSPRNRRSGRDN
ncbi:MAG: hypothetical protein O3C10_11525 [Chloroflexi bacterium]|nr:hypothetical protein [Chloroflexota bacterium]